MRRTGMAKEEGPAHDAGPPRRTGLPLAAVAQVRGGFLAALADDVVADLLALAERAHAGALDRGDMDEDVLAAAGRLDEAKALGGVEEFHDACSHLSVSLVN